MDAEPRVPPILWEAASIDNWQKWQAAAIAVETGFSQHRQEPSRSGNGLPRKLAGFRNDKSLVERDGFSVVGRRSNRQQSTLDEE